MTCLAKSKSSPEILPTARWRSPRSPASEEDERRNTARSSLSWAIGFTIGSLPANTMPCTSRRSNEAHSFHCSRPKLSVTPGADLILSFSNFAIAWATCRLVMASVGVTRKAVPIWLLVQVRRARRRTATAASLAPCGARSLCHIAGVERGGEVDLVVLEEKRRPRAVERNDGFERGELLLCRLPVRLCEDGDRLFTGHHQFVDLSDKIAVASKAVLDQSDHRLLGARNAVGGVIGFRASGSSNTSSEDVASGTTFGAGKYLRQRSAEAPSFAAVMIPPQV